MAGTLKKPCDKCLYIILEEWKNAEGDVCWRCQQASEWVNKMGRPVGDPEIGKLIDKLNKKGE